MNIIKKSKKRQFKGLKIDLTDRVGGSKIYAIKSKMHIKQREKWLIIISIIQTRCFCDKTVTNKQKRAVCE